MLKKLNVTRQEGAIFTLISLLFIVGIVISHVNPDYFENNYVVEDGPIEWLTVGGLLAGVIVCVKRAWDNRKSKNLSFKVLTVGLGVMLFFVAGEEISWGQRLFDIKSTEYFLQNNAQREINLHNLQYGEVKINRLVFSLILYSCVVLYLIAVPLAFRFSKKAQDLINNNGLLVPKKFHIFGFFLFFLLTELVPLGKKAELMEFAVAFMFLLVLWYPLNLSAFANRNKA